MQTCRCQPMTVLWQSHSLQRLCMPMPQKFGSMSVSSLERFVLGAGCNTYDWIAWVLQNQCIPEQSMRRNVPCYTCQRSDEWTVFFAQWWLRKVGVQLDAWKKSQAVSGKFVAVDAAVWRLLRILLLPGITMLVQIGSKKSRGNEHFMPCWKSKHFPWCVASFADCWGIPAAIFFLLHTAIPSTAHRHAGPNQWPRSHNHSLKRQSSPKIRLMNSLSLATLAEKAGEWQMLQTICQKDSWFLLMLRILVLPGMNHIVCFGSEQEWEKHRRHFVILKDQMPALVQCLALANWWGSDAPIQYTLYDIYTCHIYYIHDSPAAKRGQKWRCQPITETAQPFSSHSSHCLVLPKGQINEQMNRVSFASSMAEKAGSGQKVQVLCEEDVRLVAGPVVWLLPEVLLLLGMAPVLPIDVAFVQQSSMRAAWQVSTNDRCAELHSAQLQREIDALCLFWFIDDWKSWRVADASNDLSGRFLLSSDDAGILLLPGMNHMACFDFEQQWAKHRTHFLVLEQCLASGWGTPEAILFTPIPNTEESAEMHVSAISTHDQCETTQHFPSKCLCCQRSDQWTNE